MPGLAKEKQKERKKDTEKGKKETDRQVPAEETHVQPHIPIFNVTL